MRAYTLHVVWQGMPYGEHGECTGPWIRAGDVFARDAKEALTLAHRRFGDSHALRVEGQDGTLEG